MNLQRVLAVLLTSIAVTGCNCGGGGGDPDANNNQVPTQLVFTQQPTSAVAGEAVAPSVQVTLQDAEGQVVTTADGTVTLALGTNPGAGTLSGSVSGNVVAGVATFSGLSIDKAGAGYTLTASSPDLTGATSAGFDISAAAPARLAWGLEPSDTEAGQVIAPAVQLRIEDAFGNLTADTGAVTLSLQDNPGAAALQGNTTASAVDGVATFNELLLEVAADGYTLSASAGTLTSASSRPFNVRPGLPTQLVFTVQPTGVVAGAAISPAVQVEIRDARNNTVKSSSAVVSLALASNPASGTLGGTLSVAAVSGVATFADLTVDRAAAGYSLQASSGSLTAATSDSFAVLAGAPASLAFLVQPSDTSADSAIAPAVEVGLYDALGNLSTSSDPVTLSLASSPSGATLAGTATRNAVGGVARFEDLRLDKVGSYTLLASAVAGSTPSAAFSVSHGAPASLVFSQQPSDTQAGDAIAPAVTLSVLDAAGNVATSYAAPITVLLEANPSGGVLAGTTTVAATGGVASFPALSISTAGTGYLLTGTTGTLAPVTSTPFAVRAGTATQLVFLQGPVDGTAGASLAPVQVGLLDAYGNLTTSTASISLALADNPVGGSLSGTTTQSASAGVASFSTLSIEKAGSGYSLSATTAGLPSVTSGTFAISPAAASALVFAVQPVTTTVGETLAEVRVEARDAYGNLATAFAGSVAVALVDNPGGANLGGTLSQAASAGVASFADLTLDATGAGYTLGASAAGPTGVTSQAFDVVAGPVSYLVFTTQPSSAVAGQPITPSVVVSVQDGAGNTVTSFNGTISLALGAGSPVGATLSGATSVTASGGVATFSDLSLDLAGTGYTLVASGGALTPVTSASFTVNPGPAAELVFAQQPTHVTAGAAITPAIRVELRDLLGNRVTTSSANVTLAIGNNAGGGTLSGTTTRAASSGVATFDDLSLDRVGSGYTLVATSGGLPEAASASFDVTAGSASQLVFVQQPTNTTAGQVISPAVSVAVQDSLGNTVIGHSGTVSVALGAGSPSGATLAGALSVTLSSGVGTFSDLSIAKAGIGYSLVATVSGVPSVTSATFAILVGSADRLVLTQQPTSTSSGATLTPAAVAEIQDGFGNRVSTSSATVAVAFANNPTGAVLSGTLSRAAVSGVATFDDLSLDLAGTGYTLRLSSVGLTAATSAAFNISAASATRVTFVQQPASTTAGSGLGTVTVEVQDTAGNRVDSTASISLTISGGAVLTGTTSVTAVNGVASFIDLTVETAGTGYTLFATASGLSGGTSAAFNITAPGTSGLVYTDPVAGGKVRLVWNSALSTPTTAVLDLVAEQSLTGYAVGFNLPLDTTRVQANATLMETGTVLNPGSSPAAMMASLPAAGPLAGLLVTGQSQKASGAGAIANDSSIPAGSVFYRIRLDARTGATSGLVFDGAALGPQFMGLLRDKSGTDVASSGDFRIGRLELL